MFSVQVQIRMFIDQISLPKIFYETVLNVYEVRKNEFVFFLMKYKAGHNVNKCIPIKH